MGYRWHYVHSGKTLPAFDNCCPCRLAVDEFEWVGMFEDGSSPCPKERCCMWTCICCMWQQVQGFPLCFLPWYLAKMRMRAAAKLGIPPSSFAYNLWLSFAPGLVINQVHREMLIRGMHPKAKPAGGAGGPAGVAMERP